MIVLAIIWTVMIIGLATWNYIQGRETTRELATSQARAHLLKDSALRLWATQHGRIYVPVGENYAPDPYLAHIPERDISTTDGRKLSMINPASIIRQLQEQFGHLYAVSGSITSLEPLAPTNHPDEWERSALEKLGQGSEEVFEFTRLEGEPYLRLMQPLEVKAGCLLCHEYQNMAIGDIGGGIGVNLPMTELLSRQKAEMLADNGVFTLIWFLGISGMAVAYRFTSRQREHSRQAIDAMHQSERRKTAIMHSALDCIVSINKDGRILEFNPAAERTFGYKREAILGKDMANLLIPKSYRDRHREGLARQIETGEARLLGSRLEITAMRADGTEFPVELTISRTELDNEIVFTAFLRDITESRYMSEQLSYQATHDALTGVLNRHTFENHLKTAIEDAQEQIQNFLLYLDLDQFKIINRSSGHTAGDELLRQISVLLQMQISHTDVLARLGGDEFGILIHQSSQEKAQEIAANILDALRQYEFYWQNKSYAIGASIGIVSTLGHKKSVAELINAGDAACGKAKEDGRDRIYLYHPDDENLKQHQSELEWVSHIRLALAEQRFKLLRQEIKPLHSPDRAFEQHYEMLVRMVGKDDEFITPDQFIPAAEHYNLMPAIDQFVISQTFSWLSQLDQETQKKVLYCINLSGLSIADSETQQFIQTQFEKYKILPSAICFEITETVAITNLHKAAAFIDRLHSLGCRFALDDFGSGMSSYGYLKNLPVDYLKIDSEFVREMISNTVSLAMVRSIHEIGEVMGKKTIAEYVENMATVALLNDIGVDYAQGYYFSKPEPLPDYPA